MADQVDEIKQKTDIVSLIGEYIPVKKAGRNFKATCPFHAEKTPSFMISPELQMYKCFGCGEAGDVYSFLQKYEGMEFGEALRFLAERTGVKLVTFRPGDIGEKEKLYAINSWVAKFYHYILLNHPVAKAALTYLEKERKLSPQTIETFQLGFAPDAPDALKKFLVDKKKVYPKDLERLGLGFFKGQTFIDKFAGRIIFPLFDHRGNIAGFAGRVLPNSKLDTAKYINSSETPIYHKSNLLFALNLTKQEIKKEESAVVAEGELDAMSSWQAGVKNVVAIKGTALTDEQVRLLTRFTKKATLALDTDLAGDSAARRGIVIAQEAGMDLKVARFGDYKDPDEAARSSPTDFKKFLSEAVGVWDFIIDSVFAKADAKTGEGKAGISREIVPILSSIPDKIVQAHYVELVAGKLGVPTSAVTEEIENIEDKKKEEKIEIGEIKIEQKNRRQLLEERLLTLTFQSDAKILLDAKVGKLISTPLTKRIVEEFKKYFLTVKTFSPSAFAEKLPKELVEGFAEMVLRDTQGLTENPATFKKEIALVLRELEVLSIRHRLEELGVAIRQFEDAGQKAKLKKSQERFGELTLKLSKLEAEPLSSIIFQEG